MPTFIKNGLTGCTLILLAFSMLGCGTSSDDNTPSSEFVTGTAATGAAIDGSVTLIDVSGVPVSVTIQADGSFRVEVTGMNAPFMLRADPSNGSSPVLYSYASAAGVVANITPLTNLTLYMANSNADPSNLFNNWTTVASNMASQILTQQAVIKANLAAAGLLSANGLPDTVDFFTSVFNANSQGLDAVLDSITVDLSAGLSVSIPGNSGFSFNALIDTSRFSSAGGAVTGSGTLPSSVASQVVDMAFCCAAAGAPYSNGQVVKFTFSSSGTLLLGEPSTVVSSTFTVDDSNPTVALYTWDDGTYSYELSVLNNAIHEVNVSLSADNTFLGQFAPTSPSTSTGGISENEFGLVFKADGLLTTRTIATVDHRGIALAITGLGNDRYLAFIGTGVTDQLRMIPINQTGTYTCGQGPNSFRLVEIWLSLNGGTHTADTNGGSCTITVESVGDLYSGTFNAVVLPAGGGASVAITEGQFRVDGSSL